jgi:hypothetical protein
MLTTQQVAAKLDRPYPTIALWVRQGRFKNAVSEETPRGKIWWIPESDLKGFTEPKPGRPKKADEATPNAPAVTAAEMKTGDVVKTATKAKPAKKRTAKKEN